MVGLLVLLVQLFLSGEGQVTAKTKFTMLSVLPRRTRWVPLAEQVFRLCMVSTMRGPLCGSLKGKY